MKRGLILLLGAVLSACGDSKSIRLNYTVAGSQTPDLTVLLTLPPESGTAYKQSLPSILDSDGNSHYFYDYDADLKACALYQSAEVNGTEIDNSSSRFHSGTGSQNACLRLACKYEKNLFAFGTLDLQNSPPTSLSAPNNGFVIAMFFYGAVTSSATKCFEMFAAEVQNQRFLMSGGSLAESASVSLNSGGATCYDLTVYNSSSDCDAL